MKNWLSPATSKAHNLRGLYHQATAEHSPWRPIDAEQARPEYLDLIDVEILIPPLRDRLSDIGLLAQHSSRSIFLTCPSANCRSAARRWDGRPLYRDRGRMWRRSDKNAGSRVVARDGQKTKGDWHRAKPPVTVY